MGQGLGGVDIIDRRGAHISGSSRRTFLDPPSAHGQHASRCSLLCVPLQPGDGHALQEVHHQQPIGD